MRLDENAGKRLARRTDTLDFTPAELLRVVPAIALGAVMGAVIAGLLAKRLAIGNANWQLVMVVAGGAVGGYAGFRVVAGIVRTVARGLASVILPSGRSTPSADSYSVEDALLMQRDVAGALASFEAKIARDPRLAGARLRAADLYLGEGNDAARAETLLRAVQRIPGVAHRDDAYASNRLVDLYESRGDTGRALVELRRLADRYAGTRTADDALRGIATLKARLLAEREHAGD